MDFEVKLTSEVEQFILSVPVKMQAKIQRTIELLKAFGFQLPMPHSKKITEDLKELRVKVGTDICRLFYFHWKGRIYVITSGYKKKSDKTDPKEIEKASRLMTLFKKENP